MFLFSNILEVKSKQKCPRMLHRASLRLKDFKKQNFMLVLTAREDIFCTNFDFALKG